MLRFLLLSFLLSVHAVIPIWSRIHYTHTSELLSCQTCITALNIQRNQSLPSLEHFTSSISRACRSASHPSQRIACDQTLYRHTAQLFDHYRTNIPVEASCHSIKATECRPFFILCDKRKKKGHCHAIPTE